MDLIVKIQGASGGRTKHNGVPDDARGTVVFARREEKEEENEKMRRGIREEHGERGDGKRQKGKVVMVRERKRTHGSSHHVVYQRHFILIFRERGLEGKGVGMVEERESVRQRDG